MKERVSRVVLYGVFLSVVVATITSCTLYEDYNDCPPNNSIIVKAYAADEPNKVELDENTVKDVQLYVFDKEENFLGVIKTKLNEYVEIDFPKYTQFNIVAIGNSVQNGQSVLVGDGLDASKVTIESITRAATFYYSPSDLFLGSISFETKPEYVDNNAVIPIYRRVGEMNITVRGLITGAGDADSFRFEVGRTHSSINFNGELNSTGAMPSFQPKAKFVANGDLFVDDFNLFPSKEDENMVIDLYYKDELFIGGIDKDREGKPIRMVANAKINVYILSDEGAIEVTVVPARWGDRIPIWKDIN